MADAAPTPQELPRPRRPRFFWPGGLSARLLTLTVLFVAGGGALAFPPALASFERQWLLERVRGAETVSRFADIAQSSVNGPQREQLLRGAGVEWVAVQTKDEGLHLVLQGKRSSQTPYFVDLRDTAPAAWLAAPVQTLFGGPGRSVRVRAEPRFIPGQFIEVVAPDAELRRELLGYLWRMVIIVALVASTAGMLVYLSLNLFLVRPMQRITYAMERFRADPEDAEARVQTSGRRDEIGRAETELDLMQADLRTALNARARLAALGEAVAKINHDLKNMLTSAQIASERLAALKDPKVSQALPRLERALDRAVKLASGVLAYGKTQEAAPEPRAVKLSGAIEAAAEEARLAENGVVLKNEVAAAEQIYADPDQLHRILANVLRNAREAIEHQEGRRAKGRIAVSLARTPDAALVSMSDNGPGVPERVRERLFQPFAGSGRPDSTGLGLAIARELAQAHGGDLTLAVSSDKGSIFELRLPVAPSGAMAARRRPAAQPASK